MKEWTDKFVKMVNRFNRLESLDIEFALGTSITHTEVHTLGLMHENPYKKVSELAELSGITKGAISQQIKKFEKRGLIKRIRRNDNYKEVFIELTDKGKKAVEAHRRYDKLLLKDIESMLKNISPEQQKFLMKIMDSLIEVSQKSEEFVRAGGKKK